MKRSHTSIILKTYIHICEMLASTDKKHIHVKCLHPHYYWKLTHTVSWWWIILILYEFVREHFICECVRTVWNISLTAPPSYVCSASYVRNKEPRTQKLTWFLLAIWVCLHTMATFKHREVQATVLFQNVANADCKKDLYYMTVAYEY